MALLTQKLMLAGAIALTSITAHAQEKVSIGLPGAPWNVQFGYYAFGEELGFFAEEGMDLEYVSVSGSAVLLPQIASGQVHFGYASPDLTIIALDKGEPLPVRFVANWLRSHAYEFVTLADSPVKELADLEGKKLGVGALTWGNIPMSRAILANAGVTWGEEVEILPVGTGPAAWRRLETGEIDALNLFVADNFRMEIAGIEINRLEIPDQFRTIFSNGIVTSNTLIEQRPELVAGFGRAMVKSWIACKENAEACVRAYWEANPSSQPPAGQEEEQLKRDMAQVMFDRNQIDDFGSDGQNLYGRYIEDAWSRLVGVMAAEGQIESADIDLSKLFTNEFAEEFNEFDKAAVVEKAKAAE